MEDIMKNRAIILLTGLVLVLAVPATHAAIIKVEIQATITGIMDQANILGSSVSVGDEITGWYAYDAPALPSEIFGNAAWYTFNSVPYGMFFTVGGFNFETDINNSCLEVGVQNNNPDLDIFSLTSMNNISVSGMPIDSINWQLDDYTMLALDSYDLPIEAPVLTNWSYNYLRIDGTTEYINPVDKKSLGIQAVVTSAVLVPEPITIFLLATGSIAIRFRKK
jgi:hypothetical protein